MDLPTLRAFRIAAQEGSYAAAGRTLGITQAAAAARVHELERKLAVSLLQRHGKRLCLTPAGEFLLDYADRILILAAQAEERIRDVAQQRVRVAASTVPGTYILPRLMGRFRDLYPGIAVEVETLDSAGVIARLAAGTCDLALTGAPVARADLTSTPFLEEQLVLVAPPGHPATLALASLSAGPFVAREAGSGTQATVDEALRAAAVDPARLRVAVRLGSTPAVINAVSAGLGLALVSQWAAAPDQAAGRVVVVDVPGLTITRHLYIVQRRDVLLSSAAQAFAGFLREPSNVTASRDV
ncbi:MAG: LysR family transcriptional regulator [Chloroflexi bacterium]|nr:LysR family transcriptional regulator [Chloroflexota bacterium]